MSTDQIHGPYEQAKALAAFTSDDVAYYHARVKVTIYQDVRVYCMDVNIARDNAIRIAKCKYPEAEGYVCLPEDVKLQGKHYDNGSKLIGFSAADAEEQK